MSTIAVVDVGSTKTVAAILEAEGDSVQRVIAVGSSPCKGTKKGAIIDIDDVAQSIGAAVQKAEQMANLKVTELYVDIAGEHLAGTHSKGIVTILNPSRTITREDVHRVINHSKQIGLRSDQQMLMAVPRSYKVDGNNGVSRPVGMRGERLEVDTLLVTGQTAQIDNLNQCVSRAGYEVESMLPRAFASGLGVTRETERDMGVAVIDIGAGSTDIAVFIDGSIAELAMVPIGANSITSDISILLKTAQDEAEQIKILAGTCDAASVGEKEAVQVQQVGSLQKRPFFKKVLAEIIAARAKEIMRLSKAAIEKTGKINALGAGIVLTGGGSKLSDIVALAEREFADKSVRLGTPEQLSGLGDMLSGPEHASCVGLLKYALKVREDEAVAAETGDWRKLFRSIGSIFSTKAREEGS